MKLVEYGLIITGATGSLLLIGRSIFFFVDGNFSTATFALIMGMLLFTMTIGFATSAKRD